MSVLKDLHEKVRPLWQIFDGVENEILNRGKTPEMPLSLRKLDNILWGLHKKDLVVIASRPSEGKTSLGLKLAWDMADQGKTTYFVSLEMTKEAVLERLLCQSQRIQNTELRWGLATEETKKKIGSFKSIIENIPLLITDGASGIGFKVKDLSALIEMLDPKPEVVVLDYLQMVSLFVSNNSVAQLNEYIRQFKELAFKHNFVAILLSQINRAPMERRNKRPMISDLKGTGAIEETADVVMLLYWNYRNNDSENMNDYEICVAKQRNGVTGTVKMDFLPAYYDYKDKEF